MKLNPQSHFLFSAQLPFARKNASYVKVYPQWLPASSPNLFRLKNASKDSTFIVKFEYAFAYLTKSAQRPYLSIVNKKKPQQKNKNVIINFLLLTLIILFSTKTTMIARLYCFSEVTQHCHSCSPIEQGKCLGS